MIDIRIFLLLTFSFNISAIDAGVPGPRDCFWSLGPHSGDPYINLAYPDSNVYYWASLFTMPEGSELFIDGEYPYSRYMSIICLLYTSPSPRDGLLSRMPSSA